MICRLQQLMDDNPSKSLFIVRKELHADAIGLQIGLSASQGSIIAALLNLGQGLGRPVVGIFSDTVGRINIAFASTLICGVLCFAVWIPAKDYGVLIFFAIVGGTVAGTFWTTIAPVCVEVVGLTELPSALSIVWLTLVLPTTFSEPIALRLRQSSGNLYLHAQIYAGFMYIGAAGCMWFLRAWKIGQLEKTASEQGKSLNEVDVSFTEPAAAESEARVGAPPVIKSSLATGLIAWKRV